MLNNHYANPMQMTHSVCAPSVSKWWRTWNNENNSKLHVKEAKQDRMIQVATSETYFSHQYHLLSLSLSSHKRVTFDQSDVSGTSGSKFLRTLPASSNGLRDPTRRLWPRGGCSALPLRLVVSIAVIHDPMNAKLGRMFEPFIFGHRKSVWFFCSSKLMDFWETVADTSDPSNAEKKGKLYCLNVSGYGKSW